MYSLINDMLNFFGLATMPDSFATFLPWFVSVLIGVELVLYVMDMLFYTIRHVTKGVR